MKTWLRLTANAFHNGKRIRPGAEVEVDVPEDGKMPHGHEACERTDRSLFKIKDPEEARRLADLARARSNKESAEAAKAKAKADKERKEADDADALAKDLEAKAKK